MKPETQYRLSETLGAAFVALLARTLRISTHGEHHFRAVQERGPFIYACPHGRLFVPTWHHRRYGVNALISQSHDGELVARLVSALGYRTVRGSSHRGAGEALKRIVGVLRHGSVSITVDGPRGPREEPKIGTIAAARLAGVPILPTTGSAHPSWNLNSWDRFQVPRPFSRAVVAYGEPMIIPPDAKDDALEKWRLELKRRLLELKRTADSLARGKG